MSMELFFPEDLTPRATPEETRITELHAEPHPDQQRVRVNMEITPFQTRPYVDVTLTDADGNNPVVELLTGSDKYTLFAPNDVAFEALQRALGITEPDPSLTCAVDSIFGEGTLFTVLAYHVTEGRRFSNSVFNQNSSKVIETLADQLGAALESARLYQDTQRRAAQEQLIGAVTARIRESLDMETVLKTAASEMRQSLGLDKITVHLGTFQE